MRLDANTNELNFKLKSRALLSLVPEGPGGFQITCTEGLLWITVFDCKQDVILHAGERFRLPSGQKSVIQALDDTMFALKEVSKSLCA
ncbi:DUF2917 domain-containing protein [Oligoflexus tunisiensis]|uniref:DUF2917 domain-containing protein n=1 Tax=Oligoflexus tunisiensis TaxID=708132 RepID=UPI00114CB741|nr:DUF2917 domain-containing protein [Oligoflexus tunisiensis]